MLIGLVPCGTVTVYTQLSERIGGHRPVIIVSRTLSHGEPFTRGECDAGGGVGFGWCGCDGRHVCRVLCVATYGVKGGDCDGRG